MFERHLEDLLDFSRGGRKVRASIRDADDRVQREAADDDVNRRELAQDSYRGRIDPRFFGGFAKRRLRNRFSWIGCATWKTDLPGMPGQAACSDGEWDRRTGFMRVQ